MRRERRTFDAGVGATPQKGRGQTTTRPAIVFLRSLEEKHEVTLIARSETAEQLQNRARILSFLTQSPDTRQQTKYEPPRASRWR